MNTVMRVSCPLIVGVLLLVGCTSTDSIQPAGSARPTATATATATNPCDPVMGTCLGPIPAGTYKTTTFAPPMTYTVPAGWANTQDQPGDVLLVRTADPVEDFYGNNAVDVHRNVLAAAQNCDQAPESGVGHSAGQLVEWVRHLPGIAATTPVPITIGGLAGVAIDVTVTPKWSTSCPWSDGQPLVPLTVGGVASEFRHVGTFVAQGVTERLYFLPTTDGGNIFIQVIDIPGGVSFDEFVAAATPVVTSLRFGSA